LDSSQFTVNSPQFQALRERISDISDQRLGGKEKRDGNTEVREKIKAVKEYKSKRVQECKRRGSWTLERKSPPL